MSFNNNPFYRISNITKALVMAALVFLAANTQAQIRLNEIYMNPSANTADQDLLDCSTPVNGMEWIELFNASKCDTIDISCYILGSYISSVNNGSFAFPANTKMAPLSFLLVGGASVPNVDIKLSDYCGTGQFCGSSSWSLPDDKGWVALYDASGGISDAVFWTPTSGQPGLLTSDNAFSGNPCRPPSANCTASGTIKSAASMTPGLEIRYAGAVAPEGQSIFRTTDGTGSWQTNGTPTPKTCNGVCVSPSTLSIKVDSFKNETCRQANGYIAVSGTGGAGNYFYRWGDNSENPLLDSLVAGVYSVTVQDDSNCAFTLVDTLQNLGDSVIVDLQPSQVTIFAGDQVQLVASTASVVASVTWDPTDGLSCLNCANPYAEPRGRTFYVATVTDINGCIGTDTAEVDVLKDENSLFVPTGFTPDATDNNILYVRSPRIATLDFHIFDRWGKEVFVSNNASVGWDGRDKSGTKVNAGVYVYYANATFLDGKARTIHGNVTLLR